MTDSLVYWQNTVLILVIRVSLHDLAGSARLLDAMLNLQFVFANPRGDDIHMYTEFSFSSCETKGNDQIFL